MQRCLILYNLALVNRYEPGGNLDECCRLADKDRVLKINSYVTRTLVKIQREDWSAGFYLTFEIQKLENSNFLNFSADQQSKIHVRKS